MKIASRSLLLASLAVVWCAPLHSQSDSKPRPGTALGLRLSVRVYNTAAVPVARLARAEAVAADVLARANVEVLWIDCTLKDTARQHEAECAAPFMPADLAFGIVKHFPLELQRKFNTAAGFSVIPDGATFGHNAQVSLQRVEEMAWQFDVSVELVLGHAMAHEIAHLLLGKNSHSRAGLMRERWGSADLQLAARGQLGFTTEEKVRMLTNLKLRGDQQLRQQAAAVGRE